MSIPGSLFVFLSQFYTPKHVVKSLPLLMITKKSKLLAPGYQCRLCLKSFSFGQYTRLLPCTHKVKATTLHFTFTKRQFSNKFRSKVAVEVIPSVFWSRSAQRCSLAQHRWTRSCRGGILLS